MTPSSEPQKIKSQGHYQKLPHLVISHTLSKTELKNSLRLIRQNVTKQTKRGSIQYMYVYKMYVHKKCMSPGQIVFNHMAKKQKHLTHTE